MANFQKNNKGIDLFSEYEGGYDAWNKNYWIQKNKHKDEVDQISEHINSGSLQSGKATVETVLKNRDYVKESKDFFDANTGLVKTILPKECFSTDFSGVRTQIFDQQRHRAEDFLTPAEMSGNNQMTIDTPSAFQKEYPFGNDKPFSPNMKSGIHELTIQYADDHKGGWNGRQAYPQGEIGTLMLDVKADKAEFKQRPKWIGDNFLPPETQNGAPQIKPSGQQLSSGWDAVQDFTDLGTQPGIGMKDSKPFGLNIGDLLQEHLEKKTKEKKKV
jgi:hypothetical protein